MQCLWIDFFFLPVFGNYLHNPIPLHFLFDSERASEEVDKTRLTEGASINRSLVTLGNVISALGKGRRTYCCVEERFESIGVSIMLMENWNEWKIGIGLTFV